jgi:hypothetical protein
MVLPSQRPLAILNKDIVSYYVDVNGIVGSGP